MANDTTCVPTTGGLPLWVLRRVQAHVYAQISQPLTLATLATVAHRSPFHFARLFKQATGVTCRAYVRQCRLATAQYLLATTDWSIGDIGAHVGYGNQAHFTAVFRQHVGLTPRHYRLQTSGEGAPMPHILPTTGVIDVPALLRELLAIAAQYPRPNDWHETWWPSKAEAALAQALLAWDVAETLGQVGKRREG